MGRLFSKEELESCICSQEALVEAIKFGEKFTYEELGKVMVCYLYKGEYFIDGLDEGEVI